MSDASDTPPPELAPTKTYSSDPDAGPRVTDDAPADPVVDRYELLGEHARGGLGRVLRARDRRLDRTVALKVLRRGSGAAEKRFAREATITARLEHPSIVPVHDAGESEDGSPYYAMKMVSGRPLSELIREARDLDARLGLLPNVTAVAEAIAYAHNEGVIHRDLKPSNVMVGAYGETVVIDWGLARLRGEDEAAAADDGPYRDATGGDLTRAGEVLGTPAYMPPEQARGDDVDERADVYALGALLYVTLTGKAPYHGASSDELLARVIAAPPPAIAEVEPRVPRELAAIVDKAMARDPSDRYPSAAGFGLDLRRYQTGQLVRAHQYSAGQRAMRWLVRHRAALALVALAAASGLAVFGLTRDASSRPSCEVPDGELAGVWDDAVRGRVRAAMLATGDGAADVFDRTAAQLDDYRDRWIGMREAACEATHVQGVQSEQVLDLRVRCLDRRRSELAAFTASVADLAPDAKPERVLSAAFALPPIAACADVDALGAEVPPPPEPDRRARADELRAVLDDAKAKQLLGRHTDALAQIQGIEEAARQLDHAPLLAEVRYALGRLYEVAGDNDNARDAFIEAAPLAGRAGLTKLVVHCWLELMMLHADRYQAPADADAVRPYAETALALAGDDPLLQGKWHETLGVMAWRKRDWEPARESYARALALYQSTDEANPGMIAVTLTDLGIVHRGLGKYDEALGYYQRALDIYEASYGPDSSHAMSLLHNMGQLHERRADYDGAMKHFSRALAIKRRELGDDSPVVASTLHSIGVVHYRRGELDEAAELFGRALAIYEAKYGADHYKVAQALDTMGVIAVERGTFDDARALFQRSLDIRRKLVPAGDARLAYPLNNLGNAELGAGNYAKALSYCERALALRQAALPAGDPEIGETQMTIGKIYLAMGKPARAIAPFEAALSIRDVPDVDPSRLADTRFQLAKALAGARRDRDRARQLAGAARDAFEADGPRSADNLAEVTAWLAAQP